jgi:hypothetical protein
MLNPKPGDTVIRWLARELAMELRVTEVTENRILCGAPGSGYLFDRATGAEIDDDLGWGPPPKMTGSYIVEKTEEASDGKNS